MMRRPPQYQPLPLRLSQCLKIFKSANVTSMAGELSILPAAAETISMSTEASKIFMSDDAPSTTMFVNQRVVLLNNKKIRIDSAINTYKHDMNTDTIKDWFRRYGADVIRCIR